MKLIPFLRPLLFPIALAGSASVATRAADSKAGESATPPVVRAAYEIVSDDEWLAQLKDRPLIVLQQENGEKNFVLLENETPPGD